jgi:hypothetical protein
MENFMNKTISLLLIIASLLTLTVCGKTVKTDNRPPENTPVADGVIVLPGNSVIDSGVTDISSHSGLFDMSMSGYKGELFIGIADGKFYGTVKFYNWGNGVPQPLTDLRISEDKIYFKRVIKTKEDLIKYGGTAFFEQDFHGIFTPDKKTIKGYYRYIGTQDNWQAKKK